MAALVWRVFCTSRHRLRRKTWFNLLRNVSDEVQSRSVGQIKRLSIREILRYEPIGNQIRVAGWVHAVRKQKDHVFFDVGDGSCLDRLQVVIDAHDAPKQLTFGASVEVDGRLVRSEHSVQPIELSSLSVDVLGVCNPEEYPFRARKFHPPEYIRQFPHLRPRTRTFGAVLRARNAATMAVHDFMQQEGFVFVATPVITSNDCEGGGEVFTVSPLSEQKRSKIDSLPDHSSFFERQAFLTVSGQFHLEAAACGLTNVYTLGPTFRAENSKSRYHLAEFHMLEAEMAFVDTLDDLSKVIERLLKWATERLFERCSNDVKYLHQQGGLRDSDATKRLLHNPFIRLTYKEALDILEKCGDTSSLKWGQDLVKVHEQRLVRYCGEAPVFVTNFPASLKPFYMKRSQDFPDTVEGVDLLVPGVGEICGGSVREHDFEILKKRLEDSPNLIDNLQWYLDLRKYGSCPHSGFGVGFERYLQFALGVNSIKDCVLFPCHPHHGPH